MTLRKAVDIPGTYLRRPLASWSSCTGHRQHRGRTHCTTHHKTDADYEWKKPEVCMSHARQVDTTYLQVDCTLKLRNTSNGTWHTKERLSLCLPKEADIAFFFASGVAGQRRNLSCPQNVRMRGFVPPFFLYTTPYFQLQSNTHLHWYHWSHFINIHQIRRLTFISLP